MMFLALFTTVAIVFFFISSVISSVHYPPDTSHSGTGGEGSPCASVTFIKRFEGPSGEKKVFMTFKGLNALWEHSSLERYYATSGVL